jgi:acid stress-induced BolA-like protein IbaG/YrbA
MEASEVKKCIEQGIPGAEATVTADGSKYTAVVVSPEFDGKTMIAEQKMWRYPCPDHQGVYAGRMGRGKFVA